jgi:hypothetical protein
VKIEPVPFYTVRVRTIKGDRWTGYFHLKRIPTQLEIHEAVFTDRLRYAEDLKAAGADDEVVDAERRSSWRLTDLVEYAAPEVSLGRTVVCDLRHLRLGSILICRLRLSCPLPTPLTWDNEPASSPTSPGSLPKVSGSQDSFPPHMLN